ncbi:uncharacterized protein LOC130553060 [Triplophysa rosa]|uniref:uncharacterized protein LOC130553060 n=1 Tax=Triplophysa rosa TaxID=992332 RepID=UPI00254613A0|nr:uncharacterized protein LOC130553060 [Triplophysa rosa]
MSETCVEKNKCGAEVPLWLSDGHPTVEDGVVTRRVCGHWENYCCYFRSYPIRVKACPDNYYVFEFVKPILCASVYCADVGSVNKTYTTVAPAISTTVVGSTSESFTTVTSLITTTDVGSTSGTFTTVTHVTTTTGLNIELLTNRTGTTFVQNLLDQIQNITVLPLTSVTNLLDLVFNTSEKISNSSSGDPKKLVSEGIQVLKASEKLVSMLVKPTNTFDNVSFIRDSVGKRDTTI